MQGNAVYESTSHRAVLQADGLLLVYSKTPPTGKTHTWVDGNTIHRDAKPGDGTALGDLLATMASYPVFAVTCDHDRVTWHVDAEAGFSRWAGDSPESEVVWALIQCGFEGPDIQAIIDYCHEHKRSFCPRQG